MADREQRERLMQREREQREREQREQQHRELREQGGQPIAHPVVKAVGAATCGGSMLLLSGLTLAGTVIGLTLITPLLVIFSPVLVPATIAVSLVIAGFLSSGGFGLAAVTVLSWVYRYVTGRHPPGADQLEQAKETLYSKARDIKDRVEHRIDQAQQSS